MASTRTPRRGVEQGADELGDRVRPGARSCRARAAASSPRSRSVTAASASARRGRAPRPTAVPATPRSAARSSRTSQARRGAAGAGRLDARAGSCPRRPARPRVTSRCWRQQVRQRAPGRCVAADERRRSGGQVPAPRLGATAGRCRPAPAAGRPRRQRRVLAQDLRSRRGSCGPGSMPSSSASSRRTRRVGGQRVGLPPGPVERRDQQRPQPLPQRVRGDERLELGRPARPPAPRSTRAASSVLDRPQPGLLQPRRGAAASQSASPGAGRTSPRNRASARRAASSAPAGSPAARSAAAALGEPQRPGARRRRCGSSTRV